MNAGQKSARRLASNNVLSRDNTCASCLNRIANASSRRNASAAAAAAEEPPAVKHDPAVPPATATGPRRAFRLSCSPVVSRPPQITRELTSFEKAFFLYQKRLNERLTLPFQRYFYYKKATPTIQEFKRKAKSRETVGRDVGVYNAYSKDGWNDEVLVGSKLSEPEEIIDRLLRDAEGKDTDEGVLQGDAETSGKEIAGDPKAGEGVRKPVGEIVVERPAPRRTKADEENDQKSLSRAMDRTLYLLVQRKDGEWRFPEDRVYGRENLHQAAERILLQSGGINMNTWVVGNHPIGHYVAAFQEAKIQKIQPHKLVSTSTEVEREELGEKVFFMKSRIMAGQADLSKNDLGDKDFMWLTKEEIQKKVSPYYWAAVRNMMPPR